MSPVLKNLNLQESAELFKFCSAGLLYPDKKWQKQIDKLLWQLRHCEDEVRGNLNLRTGIASLSLAMTSRNLEQLQSEHFRLFGSSALCPLELAFHLTENPFEQAKILAQISGFYTAFGVEVQEGIRIDHLSVCLEFLSYLCIKVLYAREKKMAEAEEVAYKAMESFIQEFLSPGLEAILKKIQEHSNNQFYLSLLQSVYEEINRISPKEETPCIFV